MPQSPPRSSSPSASPSPFEVEHRPEASQYVLIDREAEAGAPPVGEETYLDVAGAEGTERILFHTGVIDAYAGRGLASVLVRKVVEGTIADGAAVVPVCPYVAAWLAKHPEYAAHVVEPRPDHLEAVRTATG